MSYDIAYLSYDNDDQGLMDRSTHILNDFFSTANYTIKKDEGQVLFVASGGSERQAVQLTKEHQNITILCHREHNSYAAAIEIAAFLRAQTKRVKIINVSEPDAFREFEMIQKINQLLEEFAQQKAALIGEVSDWLIISDVESKLVKEKLGIELKRIPWDKLPSYHDQEPSAEFLEHFPNATYNRLKETAKVYALLKEVINENDLSAISVECFSMVIREKVTACLPLAVLNKKNIVAACEGDICSLLGMMLIRGISKEVPWMANVAEIKEETVLFAHCTAPLHMLKSFEIATHFETNCGTAIKGKIEKQKVGVFRINNALDKYMLLQGAVIATPDHDFACRTQIELKTGKEQAKLLKELSLGNHQLIFPAKHIPMLECMMQTLNISRIN